MPPSTSTAGEKKELMGSCQAQGRSAQARRCDLQIRKRAATKMPRDNAERVVEGARAFSKLGRADDGRPAVMPQDLKMEIDQLSREQATAIAGYLAGVVGRAHARQMDGAIRRSWKAEWLFGVLVY
jgi:uncharacterized protein (DUF2252 family)